MEQIIFNARLNDMSRIKFGNDFFMGQRTFKQGFRLKLAEEILNYLPNVEKKKLLLAKGKNNRVWIGAIAPTQDTLWVWLPQACKLAKANELRREADRIEAGEFGYIPGRHMTPTIVKQDIDLPW